VQPFYLVGLSTFYPCETLRTRPIREGLVGGSVLTSSQDTTVRLTRWRSRSFRGPGQPFHKVGRFSIQPLPIRAFYPSRSKARTLSGALPVHPGEGFVLLKVRIEKFSLPEVGAQYAQ
jgi:hypothetical protein